MSLCRLQSPVLAASSRVLTRRAVVGGRFASSAASEVRVGEAGALFDPLFIFFLQQHRPVPSTRYLKVTHDLTTVPKASATSSTLALGEQYVLGVYARPPFVLSHGRGSWVWDTEGRKFLDFSAGIAVNALGHADPGVAEVSIHEQLANIFFPKLLGIRSCDNKRRHCSTRQTCITTNGHRSLRS